MLDSFVERPLFTIAKASVLVMLTSFVAYLLKFLSRVFIARVLGPDGFGQFSIGFAVYAMLSLFAGLGIPFAVVKLVSSEKSVERRQRIVYISLLVVALSSLTFIFLVLPLLQYISAYLSVTDAVLLPFVLVVFFDLVVSTSKGAALGHGDPWIRVWLTDIGLALGYILLVTGAALFFRSPVASATGFLVTIGILAALAFLYLIKKKYILENPSPVSVAEVMHLVKYSIPFLLISIFSLVFVWSDILVISFFIGSANAGLYRAATTLVGVLSFVFSAVTVLFLPVITRQYVEGKIEALNHTYSMIVKWLTVLIAPLGAILTVFGRQALVYVFGEQYMGAYVPLVILSVSWVFVYIFSLAGQVLVAMDRQRKVSRALAFSALLNVVLNILLVQQLGITGAAFATGFSLLLVNVYFFVTLARKGIVPDCSRVFLVVLIAVISTAPALLVVRYLDGILAVLFGLTLYFVTYFSTLICTGIVKEELNKLLKILISKRIFP